MIRFRLLFPLTICLLFAVLFGTTCKPSAEKVNETVSEPVAEELSPESEQSVNSLNAQCLVMRTLSMGEGKPRYYLLNICPQDVTDHHVSINIAPPGEPSVTTYFDTIISFSTEAIARAYAADHGVYDLYFE